MMLHAQRPARTRMRANSADKMGIPDDKLGWFPFPTVAGGKGDPDDTLGGLNGWLVTKGSPKEAADFLKFFSEAREPAPGGRARLLHPGGQRHAGGDQAIRSCARSPRTSAARSTTRSSTTRCSGRRSAPWSTTSRPISPPGAIKPAEAADAVQQAWQLRELIAGRACASRSFPADAAARRTWLTSVTGGSQDRLQAPSWLRHRAGSAGATAVVLLFLPPALFLFTLFVALPMGEAAWYSFYNWNGYGAPDEFRRAGATSSCCSHNRGVPHRADQQPADHRGVAGDPAAARAGPWRCCWRTACAAPATFRLIFFLPYILAEIAAGLIWRFVYDGDYGLLAKLWELLRRRRRRTCWPIPTSRCTRSWSSWSGSTSAST